MPCIALCDCLDVCRQYAKYGPDVYYYFYRPEILRMSELNDSSELQSYSSAVLYILSAITPPTEYVEAVLNNFVVGIKSSTVKPFILLTSPFLTYSCSSHGVYVSMPYQL